MNRSLLKQIKAARANAAAALQNQRNTSREVGESVNRLREMVLQQLSDESREQQSQLIQPVAIPNTPDGTHGVISSAVVHLCDQLGSLFAEETTSHSESGGIQKHPFWFWLGVVGSIASIIGLAVYFWPDDDSFTKPGAPNAAPGDTTGTLVITEVAQSARKPKFDISSFDDEIIAVIRGRCTTSTFGSDFKLVTFWQLASGNVTNYHIAKHRVGSNYELATLDGGSALAGEWDFIVGGIEASTDYEGDISIVVVAVSNEAIAACGEDWLNDSNGWGFDRLPEDGRILISAPRVLSVTPTRKPD